MDKLKENMIDKFCRDCYTTTPHKTIEIKDPRNTRRYEKSFCIKFSEHLVSNMTIPKRDVSYKQLLKI